jgi:hypothetical protein
MAKNAHHKQELVIEAVRRGLAEGEAVRFVRQNGFALSDTGLARYLRSMGGRGRVLELINAGKTNEDILEVCFGPDADADGEPDPTPALEAHEGPLSNIVDLRATAQFETRKISIRLPGDLYEAIRLAAKGEGMSQNQLIVDLLTNALSRVPESKRNH